MMAFCVGEEKLEPKLSPLMLEELNINNEDRRRVTMNRDVVDSRGLKVIIIGAGLSGLLLAMRLKDSLISNKDRLQGESQMVVSFQGKKVPLEFALFAVPTL